MQIIGIDPGPKLTGICIIHDPQRGPFHAAKMENYKALRFLKKFSGHRIAVEMIASYGMAVGADVFMTCVWIGRMLEAHGGNHRLVYRKEVKLHLCGTLQSKDSNVRQALVDRFGGKGTKAAPGLLYGFTNDLYSALAIGLTALETPEAEDRPLRVVK